MVEGAGTIMKCVSPTGGVPRPPTFIDCAPSGRGGGGITGVETLLVSDGVRARESYRYHQHQTRSC